MSPQQLQACKNAYQRLSYWKVDYGDFVEFAKKTDKEKAEYAKELEKLRTKQQLKKKANLDSKKQDSKVSK